MTDETKATPWTPGLWYVRYFPGDADPSVYAKTRTHKVPICIARVYGREGDARLIAAAPEMAEALAALIEPCECYQRANGIHGVLCERARAALAKSRGEVKP